MNREQQIDKIQAAVDAADHIPADKKAELLSLLSRLKPAIAKASQTHKDHAEKIVRLVEASTHEATHGEKKPDAIRKLVGEIEQSVKNFETSHPDLVAFATEYSALLSALGI
jgi:CRISPR/Cas system CSM-associated protein Csm2 small subunit